MPREIVTLQCGECKDRNYSTTKKQEDDGPAGIQQILPQVRESTRRIKK